MCKYVLYAWVVHVNEKSRDRIVFFQFPCDFSSQERSKNKMRRKVFIFRKSLNVSKQNPSVVL